MQSNVGVVVVVPPSTFLCSLTGNVMKEPVITKYGHNFERLELLRYLVNHQQRCPITKKKLFLSEIDENGVLAREIVLWKEEQHAPPAQFLCDLTKTVMVNPVKTKFGHHYEKHALLRHLAKNNQKCPLTGKKMFISTVEENCHLAHDIEQWRVTNASVSYSPAAVSSTEACVNQLQEEQEEPDLLYDKTVQIPKVEAKEGKGIDLPSLLDCNPPKSASEQTITTSTNEQSQQQQQKLSTTKIKGESTSATEKQQEQKQLGSTSTNPLVLTIIRHLVHSDEEDSVVSHDEETFNVVEVLDEVDDVLQHYVF